MNTFKRLLADPALLRNPALAKDVEEAVPLGFARLAFVRPQTTFDRDSVYESVSCFVVTADELVVVTADVSYEFSPAGELLTAVTHVPLRLIRERQVLKRRSLDGTLVAAGLRLRWGSSWGVDTFPAGCDDPQCQADHGLVGRIAGDDVDIAVDETHDRAVFEEGLAFIAALDELLGRE